MHQITSLLASLLALEAALVATSPINKIGDTPCTDKVYVGDTKGNLSISDDAGETWSITVPMTGTYSRPPSVYSIYAIDDDIYVGTDAGFAVSWNGGQDWTDQQLYHGSSREQSVPSVFATGKRVWAGVQIAELVCISDDNGHTWPINSQLPQPFGVINGVCAVGSRTFVATDNGLGISDDDGKTWQYVGEAQGLVTDGLVAVAAEGDNVYAAGITSGRLGTISISEDGGKTWREQDTTTKETWVLSVFAADGKVYVGTVHAGVSMSEDGGKTWTALGGPPSTNVWKVVAVGDNIYTAADLGLFVSRDGGQTWEFKDTGLRRIDTISVFAECI